MERAAGIEPATLAWKAYSTSVVILKAYILQGIPMHRDAQIGNVVAVK